MLRKIPSETKKKKKKGFSIQHYGRTEKLKQPVLHASFAQGKSLA
jgi:hypothetical protein